ncbi:leucine-rich repeat domain-containing protein [uncultured Kordia sp.]|uniref:T9SS type A sorting domain-containing protein n=1 Tax=uncultured Kordia sp. TaxID=507699 RepID=UPI0026215E07|nr:leucine-rich repeat domain-containing protein [uncultured Kordia sp.]
MKQLYFSLLLLFSVQAIQAQIVNIGDPSLKTELIADGVDTNNDGEIQLSEALAVTSLNISGGQTRTFEGIDQFTNLTNLTIGSASYPFDEYTNLDLRNLTNLEVLNCGFGINGDINVSDLSNLRVLNAGVATFSNISKFNLTGLTSLEEYIYGPVNSGEPNEPPVQVYFNNLTSLKRLEVYQHRLTALEIGNLSNLEALFCAGNEITSLDLSNMVNLTQFNCFQNQLTSLDISNTNITGNLSFFDNPLTTINIKDGIVNNLNQSYTFDNTNIQSICCDASELSNVQTLVTNAGYTGVTFETDCAPTPGTPYYTIQGKNTLDSDLNGCDISDGFFQQVEYTISDGTNDVKIYTDKLGNYEFVGKAGTYTITPNVPNSNYYSFSPANATINLPTDGTTVIQDFCLTPNGAPVVTSLPAQLKSDILAQTNVDTNGDGEIQITEAESVINLTITSPIIKGLDNFVNIEKLVCNPINNGTPYNSTYTLYLDVSPLVNLKELAVAGNRLGTLDLSQNILLEKLSCGGNLLNSLVLTNNPNLTYLSCGNLGVSNNPISPNLHYNAFKTLDLSNNTLLEYVYCSYASIETLVLGNNSNLTELYCANSDLTALDVTQLPNLEKLDCGIYFRYSFYPIYVSNQSPNQITSLDLSQNPNLKYLNCNGNLLTSLDTSASGTNLYTIYCDDNPLNTIDVSQNTHLQFLRCNNTGIDTFDASLVPHLKRLACADNALTTLDISQNPNLTYLDCRNNQITQLFVKNGNTFFSTVIYGETFNEFKYYGNPIEYICADEFEIDQMPSSPSINVNTYCSFTPGGSYNTIQGTVRFDANGNGCDMNDDPYQYLNLTITNGSNETETVNTLNDGSYTFYAAADDVYTVTPVLENSAYFTVTPASITVDFPTDATPFTQDFCITPNGTHNDVDVTLIPLNQARPGFDSNYKLVYKNKGNTTLSGTVNLTFEDDFMDLVSASPMVDTQTTNSLQWNYTNLLPFESREILCTMNLNAPTDVSFPLNADDILDFEATITPVVVDETMDDNTFTLSQTVVNSFDPNDKNCLQGTEVTTELVGKYVDYMIRFENTGTANAINVVVKDEIDISMFDPSTLIVTNASHSVATRFTNANTVEFIFENINLLFDDANNDGYVTFKIKTLATLDIDDTFENDAEIYFDYNFPIQTNNSITLIKDVLSERDITLDNFEMYPNPVKDLVIIKTKEAIESIKIFDISGKFIQEEALTTTQNTIEISTSKLAQGTYFVKIETTSGTILVKKMVKA